MSTQTLGDQADSPWMRRFGGGVPTERLRPIVQRRIRELGLTRRSQQDHLNRVRNRIWQVETRRYVSLALADRLLVDLEAEDVWHGELSDLYEAAA